MRTRCKPSLDNVAGYIEGYYLDLLRLWLVHWQALSTAKVGLGRKNDDRMHSNKGALAIECQTGTQLVSPRCGPKKLKLEASTTKVLNCHQTSYSFTVT